MDFDLPSIEQKNGFGFAASASGSARIGMGPSLVIFPMPGVPITINPMMNAEVRAMGTLNMPVGSLLQESTQLATRSHVSWAAKFSNSFTFFMDFNTLQYSSRFQLRTDILQ